MFHSSLSFEYGLDYLEKVGETQKKKNPYSERTPSLEMLRNAIKQNAKFTHPGKNAVVVGGTSGIGEGIALRLAKAKFNVTVSGRNKAAGDKILAEMTKLHDGQHKFIPCDVQLMKNCFDTFGKDSKDPLSVLVLCQGIGTIQGRTETKEGIDQKLALHYYSRIACILAMLPRLLKADNPKVQSVFSAGVHSPYELYKEDPELKQNYNLGNAANAPGFYNDLALDALSRLHPKASFTHIAPGYYRTNLLGL